MNELIALKEKHEERWHFHTLRRLSSRDSIEQQSYLFVASPAGHIHGFVHCIRFPRAQREHGRKDDGLFFISVPHETCRGFQTSEPIRLVRATTPIT
jgi:hypothetical protein